MPQTFQTEGEAIAVELHALLNQLDPARWKKDMTQRLEDRLQSLALRMEESAARWEGLAERDERIRRVGEGVQQMAELLREKREAMALRRERWQEEMEELRVRLQPAYARLAESLGKHAVPTIRPTNGLRTLLHVLNGFLALMTIQHVFAQPGLIGFIGSIALWAWTCEVIRRYSPRFNTLLMRFFGPIAHPHEHHQINSATWYATALLILAVVASPLAASVGVMVLGLADPAASLVGRRWGRILLKEGRSLEGSLAFLGIAWFSALAVLMQYGPPMSPGTLAVVAFGGAFSGTLAELFTGPVDDNFTIPLAAAFGVALVALSLGIPGV
jgi:dolichol kinase